MTRNKKILAVAGGALLCVAAYTSASYILSPAVVDSGGGHADSSSYQLDASIGGPVIAAGGGGTSTSASYTLQADSVSLLTTPAAAPPGGGGGGGGGGCVPGSGGLVELMSCLAAFVPLLLRRR